MTPAAFYAPMKPPTDPTPSGDRTMARALLTALQEAGFAPRLVSEFRSREPLGCADAQARLIAKAESAVAELTRTGRLAGWQLWVSYHNYYKAPDLIGPAVARNLSIPYVLIEATRARKRLGGRWDAFARAAEAATDAADVIFYLTRRDRFALARDRPAHQRLVHLPPFLPSREVPLAGSGTGPMLSVGMFREGDKTASYARIAGALKLLNTHDWRLDIAGDGPARTKVVRLMAPFGPRVRFRGALGPEPLARAYRDASLLFWPGVNEAFGMTYLEAQATGLPVVAEARPGVSDVLAPACRATSAGASPRALAQTLDRLLADPKARRSRGQSARSHVRQRHLLGSAAAKLRAGLSGYLA